MLLNEQGYKEVILEKENTLADLLSQIGINKDSEYFFVVNGALRLKNYVLMDGDKIKIFNVMVGG